MHMLSVVRLFAVCVVAATTAGCFSSGPEVGEVTGKVTFKGQPVTEGTVTFLNPTDGGAGESPIDSSGNYHLPELAASESEYLAVVTPLIEIKDTDPGKSPPAPVEKAAPNIPKKYRQQGLTPLKTRIKQGKNEFPIDMQP